MNYCEVCYLATEEAHCPLCGRRNLPPIRGRDFCCLTEREEIWAKLLLEIFQDNGIPAAQLPVLGAGVALKSGVARRCRIFVPYERLEEAGDLMRLALGEE